MSGRVRVRHLNSRHARMSRRTNSSTCKGLEKAPVAGEIDLF